LWTVADSFERVPGAALPLALYREHSVSREAAIHALRNSDLLWEIVYTSPSLTGVRAAALAATLASLAPVPDRPLRKAARVAC
jgi:DNA-binding transcriptional LysR family regulator